MICQFMEVYDLLVLEWSVKFMEVSFSSGVAFKNKQLLMAIWIPLDPDIF